MDFLNVLWQKGKRKWKSGRKAIALLSCAILLLTSVASWANAHAMDLTPEDPMLQDLDGTVIQGDQVAADGTYSSTITAIKRKDGKIRKGTIFVSVQDGLISGIWISAEKKQDEFDKVASQAASTYVGKKAALSTITDAVSSATQSGKSKYTVNTAEALRAALQTAPPARNQPKTKPARVAAAGAYTGTGRMADGKHYITLNVTVDDEGKISALAIDKAEGDWSKLLAEVQSSYLGTYADLSSDADNAVDAVTQATVNGYRQAIADAIHNALQSGGQQDPQTPAEETRYAANTTQTVTGQTFPGKVVVESGAVITFENCRFPYGVEIADSSATAIINNCRFGTEQFYIPLASNMLGTLPEQTEVTKDTGLTASFPEAVANVEDQASKTKATLTEHSLVEKPDWAEGNDAESTDQSGKKYHGYYLTGTLPDVKTDTYQSFSTYLKYVDSSGQAAAASELAITIPVCFMIRAEGSAVPDPVPDPGPDPGTGGIETDKDDSLELSKGVNVTNVLPGNPFSLTLDANATGTTTTVGKASAANILLVLDNTTSMTAQFKNSSGTRLRALKQAAVNFVNNLPESEDSRIAMMSFVIGNRESPTTTNVEWQAINSKAKTTVINDINGLSAPTTRYGYDTSFLTPLRSATSYVDHTGNENPTYVVFFTDGSDVNTKDDVSSAASALHAKTKAVFSVGIVEARDWLEDEDAFRAKAKALASKPEYYYEVESADSMNTAFQNALKVIQEEVSQSNATLDKTSVFRDVVNTEKFDISEATAKVTVYDYENGTWKPLEGSASAGAGKRGTLKAWKNQHENDGTLQLAFDADGTVTITGFSYKDHYLPTNNTEAKGIHAQRLHLEITGLKLKAGAQTAADQTDVPTNDKERSGIYQDSTQEKAVKYFPLPLVNIPGKGGVSEASKSVSAVTVKKIWADGTKPADSVEVELYEDGKKVASQTLNATNNWQYTWENLDNEKAYSVAESQVLVGEKDLSGNYQASVSAPKKTKASSTRKGFVEKGFLGAGTSSVTNGGTYAFAYTMNGKEYLLSTDGSQVGSILAEKTGTGELEKVNGASLWIPTKTGSDDNGDLYTLRNQTSGKYLVMGRYGTLSVGNTGSQFHISDGDGSIWSGSHNANVNNATNPAFTKFTAHAYSDITTTTEVAEYTITNTEKKMPVVNTGVSLDKTLPLATLIAAIAGMALLFLRKRRADSQHE